MNFELLVRIQKETLQKSNFHDSKLFCHSYDMVYLRKL